MISTPANRLHLHAIMNTKLGNTARALITHAYTLYITHYYTYIYLSIIFKLRLWIYWTTQTFQCSVFMQQYHLFNSLYSDIRILPGWFSVFRFHFISAQHNQWSHHNEMKHFVFQLNEFHWSWVLSAKWKMRNDDITVKI